MVLPLRLPLHQGLLEFAKIKRCSQTRNIILEHVSAQFERLRACNQPLNISLLLINAKSDMVLHLLQGWASFICPPDLYHHELLLGS